MENINNICFNALSEIRSSQLSYDISKTQFTVYVTVCKSLNKNAPNLSSKKQKWIPRTSKKLTTNILLGNYGCQRRTKTPDSDKLSVNMEDVEKSTSSLEDETAVAVQKVKDEAEVKFKTKEEKIKEAKYPEI